MTTSSGHQLSIEQLKAITHVDRMLPFCPRITITYHCIITRVSLHLIHYVACHYIPTWLYSATLENSYRLSERLGTLGIMGVQLRGLLKPLNMIVLRWSRGFQGGRGCLGLLYVWLLLLFNFGCSRTTRDKVTTNPSGVGRENGNKNKGQ